MRFRTYLIFLLSTLFVVSCSDEPIPKPVGYFRIDIPDHSYKTQDTNALPFSFRYADYARIDMPDANNKDWMNIVYPQFKAKIYLTYFRMDTALSKYINDCYTMTYKHTSKATNIEPEAVLIPNHNVYGLIYYIEGSETASPLNFYVTDSVDNFLRGSLYFNLEPNNDSLAPVIRSIETDIDTLLQSLRWR